MLRAKATSAGGCAATYKLGAGARNAHREHRPAGPRSGTRSTSRGAWSVCASKRGTARDRNMAIIEATPLLILGSVIWWW